MDFPLRLQSVTATIFLLAGSFVSGCCVTPPSLEEVRDFGFETPVQGFQSFMVALRADWPQEEYNCFSTQFKSDNGISRLGYLEFRDRLLKEEPLLRWALSRATRNPDDYQVEVNPEAGLAQIQIQVYGRTMMVRMRREAYYSIKGQGEDPQGPSEVWADEGVADLVAERLLGSSQDESLWIANVPHPGRPTERLIALTLGQEWKIDDLFVVGERNPQP